MDREYVGTLLLFATAAPALWVWNSRTDVTDTGRSARALEAHCWRAVWMSTWPLAPSVATVVGWWATVPDDCPLPPRTIVLGGLLFAAVCGRAIWRAGRSLWAARRIDVLATIGLWRPRIVVPNGFRDRLDPAAAQAAFAHEAAHVGHRDPLRIWLAQLVTDLQWPWPWPRRRLAAWRHALEMARDEEARVEGISGADLAAAIVAVARCRGRAAVAARLTGETEWDLQQRVARLLAPVPAYERSPVAGTRLFSLLVLMIVGVGSGLLFGQTLVWAAFRVLP